MPWMKVAQVAEVVAGAGTTVNVNGRSLALFLVDGQYYCLENSCPHMEGPLAEGDVEGDTVYCPWHAWPINIRTGEADYDSSMCAATYACRSDGDAVYVEIPERNST